MELSYSALIQIADAVVMGDELAALPCEVAGIAARRVLRHAEVGCREICYQRTVLKHAENVLRDSWCRIPFHCERAIGEGGATAEHIIHIPNFTGTKMLTKSNARQATTIMKHMIHICHLAGIEIAQVETCQAAATIEHSTHICHLAGIKVVEAGYGGQICTSIEPMEAIEQASGKYGRFDEAVKIIDPRKE